MALTRVLIADDDPAVRAAVTTVLGSDPTIAIVGEARDGIEAHRRIVDLHPDVVLLDIRMPGVDGITVAERVRAACPDTAVVLLTTFGEDALVDRALGAGVRGFVLKSSSPEELTAAVHTAAGGGVALSRRITERLSSRVSRPSAVSVEESERVRSLTERERRLLGLIASGMSNAEIAAELHLTEGTVKGYVSALLDRLGVRNRVRAALLGAGVTPPGSPGPRSRR